MSFIATLLNDESQFIPIFSTSVIPSYSLTLSNSFSLLLEKYHTISVYFILILFLQKEKISILCNKPYIKFLTWLSQEIKIKSKIAHTKKFQPESDHIDQFTAHRLVDCTSELNKHIKKAQTYCTL